MKYIEAPQHYTGDDTSLFLAGGITNCPDWQSWVKEALADTDVVLFNPRRTNFPMHDPRAAGEQITWEHYMLRKATAISFWFPYESLCPIVLYELGAWTLTYKKIFIGVHPEYQRRQDVEIQTALAREDITIVSSLVQLVEQIRKWARV